MVDLCANSLRREAIRRAVVSGKPTVSEVTVLNMDTLMGATRASSIVRAQQNFADIIVSCRCSSVLFAPPPSSRLSLCCCRHCSCCCR